MRNINLKTIVPFLLVLLIALPTAHAQTTTTTTTLSAAITTMGGQTVTLASGTNVAANGFLYVDKELMAVVSAVNGSSTVWRVQRGAGGIVGTHASSAKVYVAAPGEMARNVFRTVAPGGACTATNEAYLPIVITTTGQKFNCVSSLWVPYNEDIQQVTSNARFVDQTDRTKVLAFATSGITTATTRTATWPDASITVSGSTMYACGTANACSPTVKPSMIVHQGITAALDAASPSTAAVTGLSPAFTGATTYTCSGTIEGTTAASAAKGLAVTNVSGSAFTFYSANGATEKVHWVCVGY